MVSKEKALPYDRVKVSKAMDLNIEKIQFRTDEFYKEHDIDVLKGVEATAVDTQGNIVKLSNGNELQYTKLFIGKFFLNYIFIAYQCKVFHIVYTHYFVL